MDNEEYFVVSREELEQVVSDALNTGYNTSALYGPEGSIARCLKRPVERVEAGPGDVVWVEVKP